MSKVSDELENRGDVSTADEVIAATAKEAAETVRTHRQHLDAGIRGDPVHTVDIAAGVGFLTAPVLRRL